MADDRQKDLLAERDALGTPLGVDGRQPGRGDVRPGALDAAGTNAAGTNAGAPAELAAARHARWWRSRRLMLLVGIPLGLVLVVAGAGIVVAWRVQASIDHKITRFTDPFKQIPASARPQPQAPTGPQKAMNLLVFGSDSRISAGDPATWQAGAQRTDAIMVVHIPANRSGAYVVSIPRDSWVDVPGHGMAKINAAFSWGGPVLAIQTVERVTGVKIDHMVIVDFTGFARITDLLGGVKITVPKQTGLGNTSARIAAGTYTMDGATALGYVRERYTLPGGDFDREKRQQNWIRAILRGAAASGSLTNPQHLLDLLDAAASSLSTDSGFTISQMRDLVLSLRGAGPGGARFLTVPVQGTGWSPDHKQSIVVLNKTKSAGLWEAVAADKVAGWLSDASYPTLSDTVN